MEQFVSIPLLSRLTTISIIDAKESQECSDNVWWQSNAPGEITIVYLGATGRGTKGYATVFGPALSSRRIIRRNLCSPQRKVGRVA
jgi:hypothetical protein